LYNEGRVKSEGVIDGTMVEGGVMFERLKRLFSTSGREKEVQQQLDALRQRLPVPMFWLFGKTQSGKTSVVKYLTGADRAEIGSGFRPCTRFSQEYDFPTAEMPLIRFLDTRGLDEPGYEPDEDLALFDAQAHLVVVTLKVLDHAQENILKNLRKLRQARSRRPVVLVLTCLHEAYPQQQHPQPYPFTSDGDPLPTEPPLPEDLLRSITEQKQRFAGLVDHVVPVDLTPAEEGFKDPNYGGERLRQVLIEALPAALGQSLAALDQKTGELQDFFANLALPYILGYSHVAAGAGAVPVPILDVVLLSAIQTRMVYHLARLYGQPLTGQRFVELAGTLGLGMLARSLGRGLIKTIPVVGTALGVVAGSALAWAGTYALGKAFCFYYRAIHQGQIPNPDELRRYYHEQLAEAQKIWTERFATNKTKTGTAS
jgi:uncharacterized protein (DUF697 family)